MQKTVSAGLKEKLGSVLYSQIQMGLAPPKVYMLSKEPNPESTPRGEKGESGSPQLPLTALPLSPTLAFSCNEEEPFLQSSNTKGAS